MDARILSLSFRKSKGFCIFNHSLISYVRRLHIFTGIVLHFMLTTATANNLNFSWYANKSTEQTWF